MKLRVEPLAASGTSSTTKSAAATFPRNSFRRFEKGVVEALEHGVLAGYPMSNIKVVVFDGDYHDVDSSEMAFKICASICFKEAARKAKPVLLEPVMRVEVVVPDEYMGSVNGDLISRRGRLEGTEILGSHAHHQGDGPACRKCSATRPSCARARRGAGRSPCTSGGTRKFRKNIAEEIISKAQGKVAS